MHRSFNLGLFVLGVLFMSLLWSHIKVCFNWIIVVGALISCLSDNRILLLLFVTNVQHGHCTYVDFNTLSIMWRHIEQTHIRWFMYSSQNNCMFKYCGWGIFLIFFRMTAFIVCVPRLVGIVILFMVSRLLWSFLVKLIILRADITRFICIYINNIFCHAKLCTNDYFSPNSFSTKGGSFCFLAP